MDTEIVQQLLESLADFSEAVSEIHFCNVCGVETYKLMIHPNAPLAVCELCFDEAYQATPAIEESSVGETELPDEDDDMKDVEVAKATMFASDKPKQIVYGVVYPVFPEGEFDLEDDMIKAEEIEKMAHAYMINSQGYDIQHQIFNIPREHATVVESYIAPVDISVPSTDGVKSITKGSWVMATKLSDELWKLSEEGKLNAYSIYGKGLRKKVV